MRMNRETTQVSVIVAARNVERYLDACIGSILAQTHRRLDVIVVDDGSTDASGAIADRHASRDRRVRVLHQKRGGLVASRNNGLDHAVGEFVTFVDGDDMLEPDFVDYLLDVQERTGADIALSTHCFTTSNRRQVASDRIERWDGEHAVSEFLYPRLPLGAWNKLYRRDFLLRHGLRFTPGLTTGEGLEFITHAASLTDRIGVGRRKVYTYRMDNPDSATTRTDVERQGIGALRTMAYIERHLTVGSPRVHDAMRWHRWTCYNYCLRQIMEADDGADYRALRLDCIRHLRRGAPRVAMLDLPWKHRLVVLVSIVNPCWGVRLMLARRRRHMTSGPVGRTTA
ncbi:glycosyltransferase [Bifidobacterium samirii]|uniref:Glycosyl transferase n=1 Tax=Bifidobacterium samirii TaxID=2306974 RepID=A0A430FU62_9BIFI|nr:glycosyltransferase [Bifidobacterium samirii]RSX56686.1 glycosyl transferase [Bifidobacterium samirii]